MIIDIHAHTTENELANLHVTSAKLTDLQKLAEKFQIAKTVLLATYFPLKKGGVGNQKLLARVGEDKQFLVFGSLDVDNDFENGLAELKKLAEEKKIFGIKLYPGYQKFKADDKKVYPIYELAQKFSLPIMFHGGWLHHCCFDHSRTDVVHRCGKNICEIEKQQTFSNPLHLLSAAQDFPKVNFIISHLGNPYFSELRKVMEVCPNVFTDISGQICSVVDDNDPHYWEMLTRELKEFLQIPNGLERIMFGTDFPIQSYEDSIKIVESLGLAKEEKELIYYQNAAKLLKLE